MDANFLAAVIAVIGVMVALTNVITQVLKKATWDRLPTNVVAIIVAQLLTVGSGLALCQIRGFPVLWYTVAALIVLGFLVAYAAMFGFDKLKEVMGWQRK